MADEQQQQENESVNYLNEYFALKDPKEVASECLTKADTFYTILKQNRYLLKLGDMYRFYYGMFYATSAQSDHRIQFLGEQGELTGLPVNHFRNLAEHMKNMVTSNRPTMEARSINTDYKSLTQTYLANGILDYYMKQKGLENKINSATEMSIVLGASFIQMSWNPTSGDVYDIDENGRKIYEGDLEFSVKSPFDVVMDGTKECWEDHDWIVVRSFVNKYNLMAKYPKFQDKINALSTKVSLNNYGLVYFSNDKTDDVPVYEFYHKRCDALPDGRYMFFASSDTVFIDSPLPYRVIPVFRISAGNILGTPYGYSPMFDVFPIQEGINALFSSIMSNNVAFSTQNVFVPTGSNITTASLEGGLKIIEGNAKPEPLNLTQTAPETYKFLEMLIQAAETISGVNSVARGNPEASLKSGTALALVQSMALQFISGLQQSYVKLIENCGTSLIQILKDFATTPKIAEIVGKNNRPYLKEFTGEDLSSINRVVVNVGNSLSRTTSGRVEMATQLLQMGLLKNPQQYFQVLNTGSLDVTYEGDMAQLLLIKAENEKLLEGKKVRAIYTDQHTVHIAEHQAVLADPDLRDNEQLVEAALSHIQEHVDLLRNTDPGLLQTIGQQPLPPLGGSQMAQPVDNAQGLSQEGMQQNTIPETMQAELPPPGPGQMMQTEAGPVQAPNLPQVPQELLANPSLQPPEMLK